KPSRSSTRPAPKRNGPRRAGAGQSAAKSFHCDAGGYLTTDLADYLTRNRNRVERLLNELVCPQTNIPSVLIQAMRYSLLAAGKRLRPMLVLLAAEAAGGDDSAALPAACAVEMVHTYSLIHDDLP